MKSASLKVGSLRSKKSAKRRKQKIKDKNSDEHKPSEEGTESCKKPPESVKTLRRTKSVETHASASEDTKRIKCCSAPGRRKANYFDSSGVSAAETEHRKKENVCISQSESNDVVVKSVDLSESDEPPKAETIRSKQCDDSLVRNKGAGHALLSSQLFIDQTGENLFVETNNCNSSGQDKRNTVHPFGERTFHHNTDSSKDCRPNKLKQEHFTDFILDDKEQCNNDSHYFQNRTKANDEEKLHKEEINDTEENLNWKSRSNIKTDNLQCDSVKEVKDSNYQENKERETRIVKEENKVQEPELTHKRDSRQIKFAEHSGVKSSFLKHKLRADVIYNNYSRTTRVKSANIVTGNTERFDGERKPKSAASSRSKDWSASVLESDLDEPRKAVTRSLTKQKQSTNRSSPYSGKVSVSTVPSSASSADTSRSPSRQRSADNASSGHSKLQVIRIQTSTKDTSNGEKLILKSCNKSPKIPPEITQTVYSTGWQYKEDTNQTVDKSANDSPRTETPSRLLLGSGKVRNQNDSEKLELHLSADDYSNLLSHRCGSNEVYMMTDEARREVPRLHTKAKQTKETLLPKTYVTKSGSLILFSDSIVTKDKSNQEDEKNMEVHGHQMSPRTLVPQAYPYWGKMVNRKKNARVESRQTCCSKRDQAVFQQPDLQESSKGYSWNYSVLPLRLIDANDQPDMSTIRNLSDAVLAYRCREPSREDKYLSMMKQARNGKTAAENLMFSEARELQRFSKWTQEWIKTQSSFMLDDNATGTSTAKKSSERKSDKVSTIASLRKSYERSRRYRAPTNTPKPSDNQLTPRTSLSSIAVRDPSKALSEGIPVMTAPVPRNTVQIEL